MLPSHRLWMTLFDWLCDLVKKLLYFTFVNGFYIFCSVLLTYLAWLYWPFIQLITHRPSMLWYCCLGKTRSWNDLYSVWSGTSKLAVNTLFSQVTLYLHNLLCDFWRMKTFHLSIIIYLCKTCKLLVIQNVFLVERHLACKNRAPAIPKRSAWSLVQHDITLERLVKQVTRCVWVCVCVCVPFLLGVHSLVGGYIMQWSSVC